MANESNKRNRPDHDGTHRLAFERNKRIILASRSVCGICGQTVDKSLKYPHPMAPCIDHIIPIDRGGHPSDIENLQLAHWKCNREKSNKLQVPKTEQTESFHRRWTGDPITAKETAGRQKVNKTGLPGHGTADIGGETPDGDRWRPSPAVSGKILSRNCYETDGTDKNIGG